VSRARDGDFIIGALDSLAWLSFSFEWI
jgi:hypothetical protein